MKRFLLWSMLAIMPVLAAEVRISPSFNHNMVLQREMPLPVWGSADPGEMVTVSFGNKQHKTVTGKDGRWQVVLAPMPASAKPASLTVKGSKNSITFNNILVGEVWLCSGQSNMQMPMWTKRPNWRAANGDKDVKAGANKLIRITTVRPHVWSGYPKSFNRLNWEELNEINGMSFSAAAFYFGQELFRTLNIPIGLISSNWGGTRVEPWTPPQGFDSVPELSDIAADVNAKLPGTAEYARINAETAKIYDNWLKEFRKAAADGKPQPVLPAYPGKLLPYKDHRQPTVIFNTMIHALIPMAFRGTIWYQGCSNLSDGAIYRHKMQALVNGWRKVFNSPEMPFYFVQLAPYYYGRWATGRLPVIWEAQLKFARDNQKNVKMAVINDVGDFGDIHPRDKKTVGKRLSLLALKYTYGKKELQADSPELSGWKIENGKFILSFKYADKLHGKIAHFEVSDVLGNWFPASGEISGSRMIIYSDKVKEPFQLRYMWGDKQAGTIFNGAGLPLSSFRCGKTAGKADIIKAVTSGMFTVYRHDMLRRLSHKTPVKYLEDNSKKYIGEVKRIAYLVELTPKKGEPQWVIAAMDAFDKDVRKIGVPVFVSGINHAVKVKNLAIYSSHPKIATGRFTDGNIEFWYSNYGQGNQLKVPGADSGIFDFGDDPQTGAGYGSMQLHNYRKKQTVFAYNNFTAPRADIGIGNSDGKSRDWTFCSNSDTYSKAELTIFAGF